MNKKNMIVLLVISHLLCILLGYCIAMMQPVYQEPERTTESTLEKITTAATEAEETQFETKKESAEKIIATEETVETTEETDVATEPKETTPIYTQPPATQPPETVPPISQPPATEPPVTQPPATEPPATEPQATQPPAPEAPDINIGDNGTLIG